MSEKIYDPEKLHNELLAAGIPVLSVNMYGATYCSRKLTDEEQKTVDKTKEAHTTEPTAAELRYEAYLKAGITAEALAVALWESTVEGKTETLTEIQAKRQAIKDLYPIADTADSEVSTE